MRIIISTYNRQRYKTFHLLHCGNTWKKKITKQLNCCVMSFPGSENPLQGRHSPWFYDFSLSRVWQTTDLRSWGLLATLLQVCIFTERKQLRNVSFKWPDWLTSNGYNFFPVQTFLTDGQRKNLNLLVSEQQEVSNGDTGLLSFQCGNLTTSTRSHINFQTLYGASLSLLPGHM